MPGSNEVEVPTPQALTPSEILLLHCDIFAPLPPLTLASRISFEWENGFPYLIGLFFSIAILASADQISADRVIAVRIVAGLVCLTLPILWWYFRQRLDPQFDRKEVEAVRPLGGSRSAVLPNLVRLVMTAALLGNEKSGVVQLKTEGDWLIAEFDDNCAIQWPQNSLEERLRRGRPIRVSDLVHDWMGDGSHFPWTRALRLIEHSATLRGLIAVPPGTVGPSDLNGKDLARVQALLNACQSERPAIWKAMQASISAGVKSRTVQPRMESVGQVTVPKYDYNEAPISSLDMPSTHAAVSNESDGATEAPAPKVLRTTTVVLVTLAFLTAIGITLMKFRPWNLQAVLLTVAGIIAGGLALAFVQKRRDQHRKLLRQGYGLSPELNLEEYTQTATVAPMAQYQRVASWAMFCAIAALPVAIWGAWTAIFPLGILGIAWIVQNANYAKWKASVSSEVVAARVRALADAETSSANTTGAVIEEQILAADRSSADGSQVAPTSVGWIPPDEPTAAHKLPHASPEIAELLDRWTRRRASFRRLHWISLGVLIGGYTLIVLAFWCSGATPWISSKDGFIGEIPFGLIFTLIATGMALYWVRTSSTVEDESGESRHSQIAALIALWRLNILIQAPLLFTLSIDPSARADAMRRHPLFVACVLLLLLLHWLGMEWATSRVMREVPLPRPRRLVMLRVFGSPAFDDLVTLIGPWRRVGLIEHLEGFDTVGLRSDVQAAVDQGQVDRVLAKNMAEVQEQLNQASTEPDSALLFQRHAFQCTNATWRQAIQASLDRADAVLMDLSSLSMQNQGCAWELGQLLDRVPLAQVTLLVNDSTDLECLRGILRTAAQRISPDSPNRNNPAAKWQQIRIGGLSERQPNEDYYGWKRRLDNRLDPMLLTAWLLSTARAPLGQPADHDSYPFSARVRWGRQATWPWIGLLALSALWAFRRWTP